VSIDVPVNGQSNPWLDGFGRSANDPDFPAYQEELSARGAAKMPMIRCEAIEPSARTSGLLSC